MFNFRFYIVLWIGRHIAPARSIALTRPAFNCNLFSSIFQHLIFFIFNFKFFDKLVGTLHQRAPLHSPDWLLVFFNFQLSNFNFQQKKIIWSMFLLRALVCNGPAQHSLQQCWTKISLDTSSLLVSLLLKMRLVVTLTWVVFPQLATAAHFWKGWPDWNNSCH